VRRLRQAGLGLKRLDVVPDLVLSSPLRRTEETATVLAKILAPDVSVEIYSPLAPGNPMDEILHGLRPYRGARQVVMVGHQPGLGELASQLLTGSPTLAMLPFRKGGVAAIEINAFPPREAGTLQWFVTPKQLRWIAGEAG
jgi:phosphohistidine phosphatase SixA